MIYRFLIFLSVLCCSCISNKEYSNQQNKDKILAVLCIGQSNMAGRAEIIIDDKPTDNIFLFNADNQWEKATNPLNRYSTVGKDLKYQKLSLAWSFSKKLEEKLKNKKIGLIVNARGGTSIEEWQKGKSCYDEAVKRAVEAQKTSEIIGIIWHQGESNISKYKDYTDKFTTFISDMRKDLGLPNLPIVVGEIGTWRESAKGINMVISHLKSNIDHLDYVSAEGLIHIGDNSHFNSQSQLILGERYAGKLLKLLGN